MYSIGHLLNFIPANTKLTTNENEIIIFCIIIHEPYAETMGTTCHISRIHTSQYFLDWNSDDLDRKNLIQKAYSLLLTNVVWFLLGVRLILNIESLPEIENKQNSRKSMGLHWLYVIMCSCVLTRGNRVSLIPLVRATINNYNVM